MKLDRRHFLGLAAASLCVPHHASAKNTILRKQIPSSGEWIPAIGMGSWLTFDVGGDQSLRTQRTKVLQAFFDAGGRLIDSSPMYGSSQSVIGHALEKIQNDDDLFAADKVWTRNGNGGPGQIRTTTTRWGIDKFDLLQVHNLVNWQAHLETLFAMKEAGRLRYVGVTSYAGIRYAEIEKIMQSHPIDFIQITYNLVDREAENRLLPLAKEKGIAVIANRPFREGQLINSVQQRKLPKLAAEIDANNWAQFLLKFIISHPAITVAIPATRRVDHMRENMGALSGRSPDAALRRRMIAAVDDL
jgi:diketogulonate reductase-like aldo/keto reductase